MDGFVDGVVLREYQSRDMILEVCWLVLSVFPYSGASLNDRQLLSPLIVADVVNWQPILSWKRNIRYPDLRLAFYLVSTAISEIYVPCDDLTFHPSADAPPLPPLESPFGNPFPRERKEGNRSSLEPLPLGATHDGENRPGRVP